MNLRLIKCDKVVGRYWRVAVYKDLGVFLKESKDVVIYQDGGYWWAVEIHSKEFLGRGAPRATDWFSINNLADVSWWFPPQCLWESKVRPVVQIISGYQWLSDQCCLATGELKELQGMFDQLAERLGTTRERAFALGTRKGLGKGSDAGKGKDEDQYSQGKGSDRNRVAKWMSKMVPLLGSIITNDSGRTEMLVNLLFSCV